MTDGRQRLAKGAVLCRKANGNNVESQFHGALKLQHGQVFVGAGLVVAGVDDHFNNVPLLLSLLSNIAVMFTFTGRALLYFTVYIKINNILFSFILSPFAIRRGTPFMNYYK